MSPPPLRTSPDAAGAGPGRGRLLGLLPPAGDPSLSERAPRLLRDARTFLCALQGALRPALFPAGRLWLRKKRRGWLTGGETWAPGEAKVTPRLPVLPPAPVTSIRRRCRTPTPRHPRPRRLPQSQSKLKGWSRLHGTEDGQRPRRTSPAHPARWGGLGQCRHTRAPTQRLTLGPLLQQHCPCTPRTADLGAQVPFPMPRSKNVS